MAQRYVRLQTQSSRIRYGLLELDRTVQLLDAPPWLDGQPTDEVLLAETYRLLAPCAPSKIVGVGKNYGDHAAEMGSAVPVEPLLFLKPPSAIAAHDDAILYPAASQRVDYEGELALIIGQPAQNCGLAAARQAIWGYTIANDVTARDLQRRSPGPWALAKGFDSFCPLGPWMVRELSPCARIQTFLNGAAEPVQTATLDQMVYGPATLVSYISQVMTLLPGDVILTGTPAGVGPLAVGDRVDIEIEGIGRLSNSVLARPIAASQPALT
ncbi:MAG: fumarylacetoacetate hydrolase family protein [Synechococcales cyanobacterium RM1_1_8]|nr:fumarylacetoacetate hydrolase family protein [Synechococcales cyanobacterium RM1_1_8]